MKEISLGDLSIPVITPQKGIDYFTEIEQQAFKNEIQENVENGLTSFKEKIEYEEIKRQESELLREENTTKAISAIEDMTNLYNINAETKTDEFNINVTDKINASKTEIDSYTTIKKQELNQNTIEKLNEFDNNSTIKTIEFNNNVVLKKEEIDLYTNDKEEEFNQNFNNKTATFNSNAAEKTDNFNTLVNVSKTEIETLKNASIEEINSLEYISRVEGLETDNTTNKTSIEKLQEENIELKQEIKDIENTMPNGHIKEEYVHIENSSDYKAKILPEGNVKQEIIKNIFNTTWEQGGISNTGSVFVSENNIRTAGFINVNANSEVTINLNIETIISICEYKEDGSFISRTTETTALKTKKYTTSKETKKVKFQLYSTAKITPQAITDTTLTVVCPTLNYPSEIQTVGNNKNLIEDTSYKNIEVTSANINSIACLTTDLKANKNYIARIYFDDNTYVADNDSSFMLYVCNESKVPVNSMPNNIAKSYTTDVKYVKILANASGISKYANKKIKGIKIEEAKDITVKASEYSPYRTRVS